AFPSARRFAFQECIVEWHSETTNASRDLQRRQPAAAALGPHRELPRAGHLRTIFHHLRKDGRVRDVATDPVRPAVPVLKWTPFMSARHTMKRGDTLEKTSIAPSLISLGMVLLFGTRAFALNPALDVSQYAHTAWIFREGFAQGQVTSIAQT